MPESAVQNLTIPAHVPPELVFDYPLISGPVTYENPYQTIIPELHTRPPAFWAPNAIRGMEPAWVFRRAEDINRIYLDTEHFSSKGFTGFAKFIGEDWIMLPLEADMPEHTKYRQLLAPLLTPTKVAAMQDRVREFAVRYINQFKGNNHCEFMGEFAMRFPIAVFLELFGLSIDEVDTFMGWEEDLMREPKIEKIGETVRNVKTYVMDVVEQRRRNPQNDLISHFTHAQVDNRPLNNDEIWGICFTLFTGGLDTVTNSLGWHFRHLASHPEHQEALRKDPSLIPEAVEEFLRAFSIATTSRTVIKPVELCGIKLQAGERVMVCTPLGSNDPEVYDNPTEVRLDRKPRHMAFGSGIHNCVGLRLARRELHIAIEEFLKAIPPFSLKPDTKIPVSLGTGPLAIKEMHLVW